MAEEGTTNDATQAFGMVDGTYGFKLVNGEYVSDNKGKNSTTATSSWTAKYDMDNVSFKYSYSSSSYGRFNLTVAGKTVASFAYGATTEKIWSGSLKAGDTIVMKYMKSSSSVSSSYADQCKIYDISVPGWVPVDTDDDTEFTFELKDSNDNPVADAPLVIGSTPGVTDGDGRFHLKAGQTASITVATGDYTVTEVPMIGYGQVFPANGKAAHAAVTATGSNAVMFLNRPVHLSVTKNIAEKGITNDAAQAFDMVDGTYGFKLVDGEYVSNNKGKHSTTATSTWTAKYDMDNVSFKYSYSSESSCDKFTLTVAGKTIENAVSGATTVKTWSGSLKAGDTIVMTYKKDYSVNSNDDQCKVYDISVPGWAPVDTEDETEFTFELKDSGGNPVANAPLVIGSTTGVTDGEGRFHLKAGQTASITVATGDYTVTEVPTFGYKQVVPANGEAAHVAVTATGSNAVMFLNAVEDMGFRLPKTGGTGVMPVYGIGGMLALCGCAALVGIRKRKDGDMD